MHPNLQTHFVQAGDEPVLAGLQQHFAIAQSTFTCSPTFTTGYQALYRQAAADGVRVMLTAASGNLSFSYDGHARLRELLFSGRWLTLFQELRATHRFQGVGVRGLIKRELMESLVPSGLRETMHRLRNKGQQPWSHYSRVAGRFAERSGAKGRMLERNNIKLHWQHLNSWERRAALFSRTHLGGADANLAHYGLDLRDPSRDRRLVEFCLALPDEYYLKGGIERRLARLGLKHLIPESIRMDPSRGRQDVDWAYRMRKDSAAITQALDELSADPGMRDYLDLDAMRAQWKDFETFDWRHASLDDVIRYKQGLMGGMAVGQFVRWFEGRN
jgi:asparagine synthase (glutamine-hydrolysing)